MFWILGSWEGHCRERKILNPNQIARNLNSWKIFIFKSCNLECIFFILSLKAFYGRPQFVGVMLGFSFNLRQYRERRVLSWYLLSSSSIVELYETLCQVESCVIYELELEMSFQQPESKYLIQVLYQCPLVSIYCTSKYLLQRFSDQRDELPQGTDLQTETQSLS